MLFMVLKGPIDPISVRPRLIQSVDRWAQLMEARNEAERAADIAAKVKEAKRKRAEAAAEREAVREQRQLAEKARGRSHCRLLAMLSGLVLLGAIAYSQRQAGLGES